MLILSSAITVLISAFFSIVCAPVGITSSAIEIKMCAITSGIKKHKSIKKYRKKKKTHDKLVFLGKDKLNTSEVLISKPLIDLYTSQDEFVSLINVLREYNEMKRILKNRKCTI